MNLFEPYPEERWEPQTEKRHLGLTALAVAAIPVAAFAAQVLLAVVVRAFFPSLLQENWFSLTAGSVCMYVVAMPLSLLIFRMAEPSRAEGKRLSVLEMLCLLAVSLVLVPVGNIVGMLVNRFLSLLTGKPIENPVDAMTTSTPMWAVVLFMVILAPILEELFFRKLVIDRLRRYGDLPAAILSGVLFGLIHGNFSQFFYAALLGVLFGMVYCRTGRLRYTVFLHMFINFFGSVYSLLMLRGFGGELPDVITPQLLIEHPTGALMLMGNLMLYGISFVFLVPAAILLIHRFRFQKGTVALGRSGWREAGLKNPAVWALVAVLAAQFVLNLW